MHSDTIRTILLYLIYTHYNLGKVKFKFYNSASVYLLRFCTCFCTCIHALSPPKTLRRTNQLRTAVLYPCRFVGNALPLVALQYHDIKINIEFNSYLACIKSSGSSVSSIMDASMNRRLGVRRRQDIRPHQEQIPVCLGDIKYQSTTRQQRAPASPHTPTFMAEPLIPKPLNENPKTP